VTRKLRVEYPGAVYHILNRGDRREPIFRIHRNRVLFLNTLTEACRKTSGVGPSRNWRNVAKATPRSSKLARRLREETTMTLHWIAQRLNMGAAGSLANLLRDAGNNNNM
jgi:hypothetical protein